MAVIEKRKTKSGEIRYRVKIRLRGQPPQTETFRRLADARRWTQETESAIREGKYFKTSESKKHTIAEMINRYIRDIIPQKEKSGKKLTSQLNWWKNQIGHHLISDITPALIGEKRDELLRGITYRGTKRSPATVVRYLSAISHVFTIAVREWGWLEDSPMRKVTKLREARGRVRFLDDQERAHLLDACRESANPYLYTVVLIAISTGMRYGEIMNLTWADVDLSRKQVVLQETKNGECRAVPIAGKALERLIDLEKRRSIDTNLLFPKRHGTSSKFMFQKHDTARVQKVQKPAQLRNSWDRAVQKSGIQDFRFHDLRHCAASYLAMIGASLAEIADILGHKTLAMVKRYSHLSDSHKFNVVDRMNTHFLGAEG